MVTTQRTRIFTAPASFGPSVRAMLRAALVAATVALLAAQPAAAAPPAPPDGAVATSGSLPGGRPLAVDPLQQQKLRQLQDYVAAKGRVRLIVSLDAPLSPKEIRSAEQDAQAAAAIGGIQSRLATRLGSLDEGRLFTRRYDQIPAITVEADAAMLARLIAAPEVTAIRVDRARQATLAQSVPLIGGPGAYAMGATGSGQVIAIIDTGVDKAHPFLAGKVVSEACYTVDASCPGGVRSSTAAGSGVPCAGADCDHGTHVAGIAAGRNGSFSGVARDAQIIAIQVFERDGKSAFDSSILAGLNRVYALRNTFNIASVNMSLGGALFPSACDASFPDYKLIIDQLAAAGIATVIAAGNDGLDGSINTPGCISSAVTVGSTTKQDAVSDFSNLNAVVDLMAPGSAINSSLPGGAYGLLSGTSMATPHVAGAFALLRGAAPSSSVGTLQNLLAANGTPVSRGGITRPRIRVDIIDKLGPAPAPVLVGPLAATPVPTATPVLVWQQVTGASAYRVEVDTSATAGTEVTGILTPTAARCSSATNQCRWLPPALASGPARWRVRAARGSVIGTFSAYAGFTVNLAATPAPPVPIGPTGTVTVQRPTVSWRPSYGAVQYEVAVIDATGIRRAVTLASSSVGCVNGVSPTCSHTLTSPLAQGTVRWSVKAITAAGKASATGASNFTYNTQPAGMATLVSPLNTTTNIAPLLRWRQGTQATQYRVAAYRADGSTIFSNWLTAAQAKCTIAGALCEFQGTAFPGGTIRWAVMAANANGNAAWTPLGTFTVNASLPPVNDRFASALTIATGGQAMGTNVNATLETGEPLLIPAAAGRTVWWRWVAPASGVVMMTTDGSGFDTILGVYTGNATTGLTLRAVNDDANGRLSAVAVAVTGGVAYSIVVDGYSTTEPAGKVVLNVSTVSPAGLRLAEDGLRVASPAYRPEK
ncbi:S8 family serine peptidase [Zavarzinia sp. CC-PAN008]|uniref:S8 family serine peptidase n=1 Tax=Zavarzinia sp. CC-PAN008 TaxID=3243332 RepID=UPI003F7424EC